MTIHERIAEILQNNRYSPILSCCPDEDLHAAHVADVLVRALTPDIDIVAEAMRKAHLDRDFGLGDYRRMARAAVAAMGWDG